MASVGWQRQGIVVFAPKIFAALEITENLTFNSLPSYCLSENLQ